MKPDSQFIKDCKELIEKNSPLSMALSFELVKRGAKMNVKEALEMDYRVVQALLSFPDYYVGVH